MRLNRSTILFTLALLGFAVLSLTPRGLALCIGGGHELAESIAGWCEEHSKHVHAPREHDHEDCDHAAHAEPGDPHHQHHDDHPEPCADIPLGLDDCRPQVVNIDIDASHNVLAAPLAQLHVSSELPPATNTRLWHQARDPVLSSPPATVRDVLRAVILLI